MSELPDKIEQTSTQLMRSNESLVGRTLAHSLEPLVDHLRACLQMLEQRGRQNEQSIATTVDRVAGLEFAQSGVAEVLARVARLEDELSRERQQTILLRTEATLYQTQTTLLKEQITLLTDQTTVLHERVATLQERMATLETIVQQTGDQSIVGQRQLREQINSLANVLSIFSEDESAALNNFVTQIERLSEVVHDIDIHARHAPPPDILNTCP